MKKVICILLISIISLFSAISISASQSNDDSFTISEQEYQQIQELYVDDNLDNYIVIKAYGENVIKGFADGKTVYEIAENCNINSARQSYVLIEKKYPDRYIDFQGFAKLDSGEMIDIGKTYYLSYICQYALYGRQLLFSPSATQILNLDSHDFEILNTYCFVSDDTDPVFIYFVTNQGDFVYYSNPWDLKECYILPKDAFYEFAPTRAPIPTDKNGINMGIGGFDLAPYQIEPLERFNNNYLSIKFSEGELEASETTITVINEVADEPQGFNLINLAWIIPISIIFGGVMILIVMKLKQHNYRE